MGRAELEKLKPNTVFDTETKGRGVRTKYGWRRADSEGRPKGQFDMNLNTSFHGMVDVVEKASPPPKGAKQQFVSNVLNLRPGTLFSFNLGDKPDGIVVRGGLWKRINKWPLIDPETFRHSPGTVWAWVKESVGAPAEGKKMVEKLKKQLIPISFLPVGSVFDYNGHRYVVTVAQKQFADAQKDGRIRPGGTAYTMTTNVMVEWIMSTEGLDGKRYQESGQQALVFAKREIQGVTDAMMRVEDAVKTLKGDVRAIARDMMAKGKGKGPEREQRLDRREKKPRGRKPKAQPEEYRHEDDDIPF